LGIKTLSIILDHDTDAQFTSLLKKIYINSHRTGPPRRLYAMDHGILNQRLQQELRNFYFLRLLIASNLAS
jgi:hypothetical protein